MKRIALLLLVVVAPFIMAQSTADPSAALKLQMAQKDLQIAGLTKQLHEAQRDHGICQAALAAVFTQQAQADDAAIANAQAAVKAASPAPTSAPQQH